VERYIKEKEHVWQITLGKEGEDISEDGMSGTFCLNFHILIDRLCCRHVSFSSVSSEHVQTNLR
jgi:hypothetical protein